MKFSKKYIATLISMFLCFGNGYGAPTTNPNLDTNQSVLTEQLKLWVAKQQNIEPNQVEPSTTDRRFKVPDCLEKYSFSYPFSGKGTVKAICDSPGWEAYVRVRLSQKTKAYHGFVYTDSFKKGHILGESDIEMTITSRKQNGLATRAVEIIGKSLTSNVNKSDFIRSNKLQLTVNVFQATKTIYKGDYFSENNYRLVNIGAHLTSPRNRFKEDILKGSKANQTLNTGEIIPSNLVDKPYNAFVAKKVIYKGDRITEKNAKSARFWGRQPAGVVINKKSLRLTQAGRTVREGDLLRISDLKPAILIKRGDTVVLTIQKGALIVSVSVEALGSGKMGDIITLKSFDSGERLRGKITGTRTAAGL